MAMSQVGEFSFVLASAGLAAGVMTGDTYQWFVASAVATIGATPFMMAASPRVSALVTKYLPVKERRAMPREDVSEKGPPEKHLLIIGYGVNGRNVSKAAELAGMPYLVIDMNPSLVAAGRAEGVPIHYGDATRAALLEHVGVRRARAVVIVLSDAAVTRQVTALVRNLNVGCTIVARTRYVREVEALKELGADTVIPEELETSVQIVSRVLASYLVPRGEIDSFVSEIRAGDYEMWRSRASTSASLLDVRHAMIDVEVTSLRVEPGSPLAGQRLIDSDLRRIYGVTVVAIRRGDGLLPNPGAETVVEAGDLLVVLGLGEEIAAATVLTTKGAEASSLSPSHLACRHPPEDLRRRVELLRALPQPLAPLCGGRVAPRDELTRQVHDQLAQVGRGQVHARPHPGHDVHRSATPPEQCLELIIREERSPRRGVEAPSHDLDDVLVQLSQQDLL
jgi:CPA2 family monovalent cation:H+ antiporter-2